MGVTARIIGADGEVVAVHRSKILSQNDQVPTSESAREVFGDTSEEATKSLFARLQSSASMIGIHTNIVRVRVKQNVDALQQAVEAMENNDEHTTAWAQDQTSLVTQTAETTTDGDVLAGAAALAVESGVNAARGAGAGAVNDDGPVADDTGNM